MSDDYPVVVEVTSPPRFARTQLLLRIVLAIALGWIGITAGWLVCTLYVVLPVIAAIVISTGGREAYVTKVGPKLWRALAWLLQLGAYMAIVVDRFPTGEDDPVHVQIRCTGQPTVLSALSRLVTSIPSGFVLLGLWCVSTVLWIVAACAVLLGVTMPDAILAFQRGVLRWQARLVAYHASFVDDYPPFSFDGGDGHDSTAAAAWRAP